MRYYKPKAPTIFDDGKRSQAERLIAKFGGYAQLAAAIDVDRTTVYKWTYPRVKGGTDGVVPSFALGKIRKAARFHGVLLTDDDLSPLRK